MGKGITAAEFSKGSFTLDAPKVGDFMPGDMAQLAELGCHQRIASSLERIVALVEDASKDVGAMLKEMRAKFELPLDDTGAEGGAMMDQFRADRKAKDEVDGR